MNGRTALITLLLLLLTTVFSPGASSPPQIREFVEGHSGEILRIDSEEALKNYLLTHLLTNYRETADMVEFTDALTSGVYSREVKYILKEKILETAIDARTLKSTDRLKVHLARVGQAQPLTVNINDSMKKIGYGVTAAMLATQVYRAFLGSDDAKREAVATAFSAELDWLVTRVGSASLSVSMGSVHFLDYALKKFITAQYDQYNEFWWNAYSAYYNQQYRSIVKGPGSWASLAEVSGGQGIEKRLGEFWKNPLGNAAMYYKNPSPFQRDALAAAKFRKPFAARYYHDYLKSTLDTHFSRKVEAEKEANLKAAEEELKKLTAFLEDMNTLKKLVAEARKKMKDDAGLSRLTIYRVTHDEYNGRAFTPPAQNGDTIHFAVNVEYPPGAPVPATLQWAFQYHNGEPVVKGTTREVCEAGVTKPYGYRLRLKGVNDGPYRVVVTYQPNDKNGDSVSASYPLEVLQAFTLDRLVVTGNRSDPVHRKTFAPGDTLYFLAYYTVKTKAQGIKLTLTVRDQATGALLKTAAFDASAGGSGSAAAELSLPPGAVTEGGKAVFIAAIESPEGRKLALETEFAVESYRLALTAPPSLNSDASGEFSVKVPESFKPPYQITVKPSGGIGVGPATGSLGGTVGVVDRITEGEREGRLTVLVRDAENRTAEETAIIRILPAAAAPSPAAALPATPGPSAPTGGYTSYPPSSSALDIAGTWSVTTVSNKTGESTYYRLIINGSGSYYTGRMERLGSNPYSWDIQVTLNQATGDVSYTQGSRLIRLVHMGRVAPGGRTASGTYYREGGPGTAWNGTWSAVKQ